MTSALLAQAIGTEISLIQAVTQGGAFGLVVFLVVWFVVKLLPRHLDAMKALADDFKTYLKEERLSHQQERDADRLSFSAERALDRQLIATAMDRNTVATKELTQAFRSAPHRNGNGTNGGSGGGAGNRSEQHSTTDDQ